MCVRLFNKLFIINIGLSFLLTIFLVMVVVEYYFFKQQATELVIIQEQYRTALTMLRKSLDACGGPDEESRDDEDAVQQFSAVNRDPIHLKNAALSYLRKQQPNDVAMISAWYSQHNQYALEAEKQIISGKCSVLDKTQPRKKKKRRSHLWAPSRQARIKIDRKFSWPLERTRFWISSLFGNRHRSDGSIGFHTGIDLAALRGTPVYAVGSGKIIEAGYDAGYGNTVVIRHSARYKTRYAHMNRLLTRNGQIVGAGQKIGTVGATGNVRAAKNDPSHLHFEIFVDGKQINPLSCLP